MGLSVPFSGKLSDFARRPQLMEEVRYVCYVFGRRYRTDEDEYAKGGRFSPPACEPFAFAFYEDGEWVNKMYLRYRIGPSDTVSVKTQVARIESHIAAVKLLKHLAKKYVAAFNVKGEGNDSETGGETVL